MNAGLVIATFENQLSKPIDTTVPIAEPVLPPTQGMTKKVVKGSIWTLAGQLAPLGVSLAATPFTIRLLGSEAYGVLILVGLIPTYFGFADFGMSIASTKFASSAFGEGDRRLEAGVVRTSALIAFLSAALVAVPLFIFSWTIVKAFNVPEAFLAEASGALKLASGAFLFGVLSSVLNSPMLARLRMDLNQITVAIPKILAAGLTPVILYLGGGIFEAVGWAFLVALGTLLATLFISGRLLPELFATGITRDQLKPILKFGGATMIAAAAGLMLTNLEKLVLTSLVSVKALAFYSVAFLFANTATFFSQAMLQSLIPAFSQLSTPDKREYFDSLFTRTMRLTFFWMVPSLVMLLIIAKPFFTYWAGPEFGEQSTQVLYLLLIGLFFGLLSFVPIASITGFGRNDLIAKIYWIELPVYMVLVIPFVYYFGILGAAVAWSLRIAFDSVTLMIISKMVTNHSFRIGSIRRFLGLTLLVFSPQIIIVLIVDPNSFLLIPLTAGSLAAYGVICWKAFLTVDEREWCVGLVSRLKAAAGKLRKGDAK